MSELTSLRDM